MKLFICRIFHFKYWNMFDFRPLSYNVVCKKCGEMYKIDETD